MDHCVGHDLIHARVDFFFAPEEACHVLYPFEVADGNATGVTDHVRYHNDTAAGQYVIGIRVGWAVCPFEHQLTGQRFRAMTGDLAFKRSRDQNIHLHAPERFAGDGFSTRETGNLFVL
ncbi:hypothetical protein D3C73_1052030 [compost metagenome]